MLEFEMGKFHVSRAATLKVFEAINQLFVFHDCHF